MNQNTKAAPRVNREPHLDGAAPAGATPAIPLLVRVHYQVASAMVMAARSLGFSMSREAVLSSLTDGCDSIPGPDVLGYRQSGRRFGLNMDVVPADKVAGMVGKTTLIRIDPSDSAHPVRLLVAGELGAQGAALVFDDSGGAARDPHGETLIAALGAQAGGGRAERVIWLRTGRRLFSAHRLAGWMDLLGKEAAHLAWLREALMNERSVYKHAAMASAVLAVFSLITPTFSMVVYNTVAPKAALNTLTTLAVGMALIMVFDFVLQELRSAMVDKTARRLDVVLSRAIYEQQLNLRLEHARGLSGTQADMLRGYTTVQEFFTSAVLLTLIDLPLSLMALGLMFYIGGWLALIAVIGIVAMLVLNVVLHKPMERASRFSTLHGQDRHGTLVESIVAAETIRAVGAERTMRRRWRDQVAVSAVSAHQMRFYQQLAAHSTAFIVQTTGVLTLVVGAVMISDQHLSSGALIAVGMLNSRVMAPFSQLAGLLVRLYHTRTALRFLSRFMGSEKLRGDDCNFISRPDLQGSLSVDVVSLRFPAGPRVFIDALKNLSLTFNAGEHVAILGRNGSGKSTLLKVLAGVLAPETGVTFVDGVDMQQIDPAEVRGLIGYVQQEPLLLSGTLRENLIIGWPEASDADVLRAAVAAGVDDFAKLHPEGYGMRLGERGAGLSAGQKQAVAIAQVLIRDPKVLLLDEPTSALDPRAEQQLLSKLALALTGRTLIVVTHRPAILSLTQRVVVMEGGSVLMDKPRDEALLLLSGGISANTEKTPLAQGVS
jgi:ATP-binding cassette subfamily C protein LapB